MGDSALEKNNYLVKDALTVRSPQETSQSLGCSLSATAGASL